MFFRTHLTALLIFILLSQKSLADFTADVALAAGYTRPSPVSGESPVLGQFGAALTLGYKFLPYLYAGVFGEYRIANQYSSVISGVGNFRGNYSGSIGPTVGLLMNDFVVQVDAKMMGEYQLLTKRADGTEVHYTKPSGYRANFGYQFWPSTYVGLFYESLQFAGAREGATGEADLLEKISFNQTGIFLKYFLFDESTGGSSTRGGKNSR